MKKATHLHGKFGDGKVHATIWGPVGKRRGVGSELPGAVLCVVLEHVQAGKSAGVCGIWSCLKPRKGVHVKLASEAGRSSSGKWRNAKNRSALDHNCLTVGTVETCYFRLGRITAGESGKQANANSGGL